MSSKNLILFFDDMAMLLGSGIPMIRALSSIESSSAFSSDFRNRIRQVRQDVENGEPLTSSLIKHAGLPDIYISLLEAGEKSGKLPDIFKNLSAFARRESVLCGRITSAMLYPAILLHIALLVFPLDIFFSYGLSAYLRTALPSLAAVYISVFSILYLIRWGRGMKTVSGPVSLILSITPFFGKLFRNLSLYRFYISFYHLFDAGHDMTSAFIKSSGLLPGPAAASPFVEKIRSSLPLQDALKEDRFFPHTDAELMANGEMTGTLDEKLRQLMVIYEEKIEIQFKLLERFLPVAVYMVVVIYVAWRVISFWMGYFDRIMGAF